MLELHEEMMMERHDDDVAAADDDAAEDAVSMLSFVYSLLSACQATVGGCWNSMAEEIEAEAEIHRSVGNGIVDEIIKPIKSLVEAQSKAKKQIEQGVDKKAKVSRDKSEGN